MSKRKYNYGPEYSYSKLEELLTDNILDADVIYDDFMNNSKRIDRIFYSALMHFQDIIRYFKDIKIETDVQAFYETLSVYNYLSEESGKEYSNGQNGLTLLVRTLFPHRKDADNISGRQLFEGEYSAQEQCNEILGENWETNERCYICNIHSDDLDNKLSCEHVLPVMQAATVTGLLYRGMSKELKKDLYDIIYAPACHCCNYAKKAIFFIDFELEDWMWKHDPRGIQEVINRIRNGGGKTCTEAHILNLQTKYKRNNNPVTGKKEVNKDVDRYWQIRSNMKKRCNVLNEYYLLKLKTTHLLSLDEDARKELYNYLTMANVLLSIRPENIQHIITNYSKKRKRQFAGKTAILPSSNIMNPSNIENESSLIQNPTILDKNKLTVHAEPMSFPKPSSYEQVGVFSTPTLEMDKSEEDINQYIYNEIMKDIETKQAKLESIFEIVEQNIKTHQEENPTVKNSHINRLIEFKKQHPEAFTENGFNFDYWKGEDDDKDIGGKKTQKKNRSKKRKTKRKIKRKSRKRIKI